MNEIISKRTCTENAKKTIKYCIPKKNPNIDTELGLSKTRNNKP